MKFIYYFCFFFLMSFSNKVNAMEFDYSLWHGLERPLNINNISPLHFFELGCIGISSIYAGYETIRILFLDKIFNDNKLYLITNITNLLGWVLILFGFFLNKGILCEKVTLHKIATTCTLVSTISSTINFIIREEFKKDLTSSILGCLKCVLDLFLSFVLIKQWDHVSNE